MPYDVRIEEAQARQTAVVTARLPMAQVPEWMSGAFREVFAVLGRQGVGPAGPPFAWYTMAPEAFEIEAGVPALRAIMAEGRVTPGSLPGGPVAVTTHLGPYDRLGDAVEAATRWAQVRGIDITGPHWEVYHTDPSAEPDPERWRTDVVVPLALEAERVG